MATRHNTASLGLFATVQFLAISADRLKQFSFVAVVGLLATGSSAELLKLNLFMQLPVLLFTPLAGTLLDRWSKSWAIILSCTARAAILLALPVLLGWAGSLYALYSVAAVLALADLVFAPARSALLPEIVGAERLLRVNAVLWILGVVGTLGGFLAGGWLIDSYSWRASFVSNSTLYVLAAAVMVPVALFQSAGARSEERAGTPLRAAGPLASLRAVTHSIADSVRLIRADSGIALGLTTQSVLFGVGGVLSVIAVSRVQAVAPDGRASFLSITAAALVVGMIAGSGLSSMFRDRVSVQRTVAVAALLSGVAIAGIGRTETLVPLGVWAALLGMSISPVFIVTETLIQHKSPAEFLGRVFAAREALIKTAFLTTAAVATAANEFASKPAILVSLGLFLALLGVVLERTHRQDTSETQR